MSEMGGTYGWVTTSVLWCVVAVGVAAASGCGSSEEADEKIVLEDDAGEGQPTAGLTCPDIARCLGECPRSDEACPEECGERGSDEGLQLLESWWNCVQAQNCDMRPEDEIEPCIRQHCEAETRACVEDGLDHQGAPGDEDIDVDTGSIPDALVGTWSSTSTVTDTYDPNTGTFTGDVTGSGYAHHFEPDGAWWSVTLIRTHYGCTSTAKVYAEGRVGVEGGVMTTRRTAGKSVTDTCGTEKTKRLDEVNVDRYRWRIDRSANRRVLSLDQIDGDLKHRLFYEGR